MRNALAGIAVLALAAGMVAWQEPAKASSVRRKAAPSFFRQYHASFQGAAVTTTGTATVMREDGWIQPQTGLVPGSTALVQGAPHGTFLKLNREGASLSLFAWRNVGVPPDSKEAIARVLAGGLSGTVRRGFGFKWVLDQVYGFTLDGTGAEVDCKLGPAGQNDLLALVGPSDVEFYVDGVALGSLPIPPLAALWGQGGPYEISITNGPLAQNNGLCFHSLKIETPH
jgi:hypothetical protein